MKIAYTTTYDVLNPSSYPRELQGLCTAGNYISKYLQDESAIINYLGPLTKEFAFFTKAKWSFYRYLFKKDYYRWAEPLIVKNYGRQVEKKMSLIDTDIVLCPENIVPIADLNCQQPIVLWTDATMSSLINFYRHLDNLCDENIRNIYKLEASALNRCQLIIYTSEWAAESAIKTYNIPASKVKVVPFGANLECNRNQDDIEKIISAKDRKKCKLLFAGVDWIRKGGDIAFEVAKELNKLGLKTELIVVGCQPKINGVLPEFVKVMGFIDKSKAEGMEKINSLFAESHFLILPSRADTFGHVFCEASSFGLPSIATNVGGISSIVINDINGKTFFKNASVDEYCSYIISIMNNYGEYEKLAYSSFGEYQTRLNWQSAVNNVKQLMQELINN